MILINTRGLILERFDNEAEIPPYAILSHTWGKGEVSLQQFERYSLQGTRSGMRSKQEKSIGDTQGYKKIVRACREACEDGYEYIWVDTCCIDKTSSAELSEAINSMFRWYEMAEICYALLDDVITSNILHDDFDPKTTRLVDQTDLADARWFKRGWTLQELIAPQEVYFFAKDWKFVGSRTSLLDSLTHVTGIDKGVLNHQYSPQAYSIAHRMSWAANRCTTRIEDIAYCLLGIFDINMSLIYGEGAKAFMRLQEELLKDSEDQSLFAWNPQPREIPEPKGISIFASHPREFAASAEVGFMIPKGEPPTVTNKGVRMELPILALTKTPGTDDAIFLMILYCSIGNSILRLPAIPVRRLLKDGSSHTYIRHETQQFYAVNYATVYASDARHVFLRKSAGRDAGWQLHLQDTPRGMQALNQSFKEARTYQDVPGNPREDDDSPARMTQRNRGRVVVKLNHLEKESKQDEMALRLATLSVSNANSQVDPHNPHVTNL